MERTSLKRSSFVVNDHHVAVHQVVGVPGAETEDVDGTLPVPLGGDGGRRATANGEFHDQEDNVEN
jgi:hypothetical protein